MSQDNLTPGVPGQVPFKSEQYEFNDEQNRTLSNLAESMGAFAQLMKILGLGFGILCGLQAVGAIETKGGYGALAGLGAATLLCLSFGFWTSSSAGSFRKIVETRNEDVWHLMNALGSLKNMYSLMRMMIIGSIVIIVVAVAVAAFGLLDK